MEKEKVGKGLEERKQEEEGKVGRGGVSREISEGVSRKREKCLVMKGYFGGQSREGEKGGEQIMGGRCVNTEEILIVEKKPRYGKKY